MLITEGKHERREENGGGVDAGGFHSHARVLPEVSDQTAKQQRLQETKRFREENQNPRADDLCLVGPEQGLRERWTAL